MRIEIEIEAEGIRVKAAVLLDLTFPFGRLGEVPKVVPMSGEFPRFFPQRALRKIGKPLFILQAFEVLYYIHNGNRPNV